VKFRSGTRTDDAVRWAAAYSFSGLEDFAGLPGTIGGAVWMNARCYEHAVSDILVGTTFLDECLERVTAPTDPAAFAYKKSPFQGRKTVILEAVFSLRPGEPALVADKTAARRAERAAKGHFRYPSAGSIFKNNRDFGKPTGKIIEELGLRGFRSGGAQIAPWHGNFIINTGGATADDVRRLITLTEEKAFQTFGFKLEREVIYVG
jgi:UDP-N-acetylmuramate dehydrogenase